MIIWINGTINSGKSTVAKLLAKKIPNCAIVEIDKFHEMISWMPIDKAVPINLKNALASIKIFNKEGLNIIVPYPLSDKNYKLVNQQLKKIKTKIIYITLSPKLEIVLQNRGKRKIDQWERKRIKYHYHINIHQPSFGKIIDNSNQTPQQTVEEILRIIRG